mmetsp:Transcript_82779/g.178677  ORF Transcript_82779/g.178677 Transcript_82779/m.178677 type:complete len:389 (+) Transcript_82779:1406-2572(+)
MLLEVGREHHEDVEGQAEDLRDRGDAVLDQRDAEELLDDGDEGLAGAEDRAAVLQHAEHELQRHLLGPHRARVGLSGGQVLHAQLAEVREDHEGVPVVGVRSLQVPVLVERLGNDLVRGYHRGDQRVHPGGRVARAHGDLGGDVEHRGLCLDLLDLGGGGRRRGLQALLLALGPEVRLHEAQELEVLELAGAPADRVLRLHAVVSGRAPADHAPAELPGGSRPGAAGARDLLGPLPGVLQHHLVHDPRHVGGHPVVQQLLLWEQRQVRGRHRHGGGCPPATHRGLLEGQRPARHVQGALLHALRDDVEHLRQGRLRLALVHGALGVAVDLEAGAHREHQRIAVHLAGARLAGRDGRQQRADHLQLHRVVRLLRAVADGLHDRVHQAPR